MSNTQTVRHPKETEEQHHTCLQDTFTRQLVRHQNEMKEQHHTRLQDMSIRQTIRHQNETDKLLHLHIGHHYAFQKLIYRATRLKFGIWNPNNIGCALLTKFGCGSGCVSVLTTPTRICYGYQKLIKRTITLKF